MRFYSRGDTIIEVILAFVVFSMLAVGAITLMNRGVATAQYALESTLVRQQIDAQAEAIRYVRDAALRATSDEDESVAQWREMTSTVPPGNVVSASATTFTQESDRCPELPSKAFFINAHNATMIKNRPQMKTSDDQNSTPYARVMYDEGVAGQAQSSGLWIEAVKASDTQKFVDFHIRACWYSPHSPMPATTGTIVRMAVL